MCQFLSDKVDLSFQTKRLINSKGHFGLKFAPTPPPPLFFLLKRAFSYVSRTSKYAMCKFSGKNINLLFWKKILTHSMQGHFRLKFDRFLFYKKTFPSGIQVSKTQVFYNNIIIIIITILVEMTKTLWICQQIGTNNPLFHLEKILDCFSLFR